MTTATPQSTQGLTQDNFARNLLSHVLPDAAKPRPEPRQTTLGTPCARSWDAAWIAKIEAAEQRLGRRICGARTPAGNPCEFAPAHENGRCKFHGGFALTGAPQGNRNAVIHGLYSRRLKTCSQSCPLWKSCPCASPEVRAVKTPDQPTCPYEQSEYDTALTDALARAATNTKNDAMAIHTAHNVALMQVMINRAAVALRDAPLTDRVSSYKSATENSPSSESYTTKPSSLLLALTRIANEYRRFVALLGPEGAENVSAAKHLDHTARTLVDTSLDPDRIDLLHPDAARALEPTQHRLREALECAVNGDDAAACAAFTTACELTAPDESRLRDPDYILNFPNILGAPGAAVQTLQEHITGITIPKPRHTFF